MKRKQYLVTVLLITAILFAPSIPLVHAQSITLSPISGPVGTQVTITGSGFNTADTCSSPASTSSSPTDIVTSTSGCQFTSGSFFIQFIVSASASPGQTYTVTVTGSMGDSANAGFTVCASCLPTITTTLTESSTSITTTTSSTSTITNLATSTTSTALPPTTNPPLATSTTSTTSVVTGPLAGATTTIYTSVVSTSTTTTLTTSSSDERTMQTGVTTLATDTTSTTSTTTSFTTTTAAGTITVTETDTVNVFLTTIFQELHQLADEILQLIGNQPVATPLGQQINEVTVTRAPISLTVNPPFARSGATVQVTASGFSPNDSGCSLSGGVAIASETCSISNGVVTASFVVANAAVGSYTITLTGNPTGDSASAIFTLTTAAISITVNPSEASAGANVQVFGSGFSFSDTSCSLSSVAIESPYCSVSDGTLSGSFEVANVGIGYYTVTAIGSTGDSASTTFGVAPSTAPAIPGFPIEAILLGLLLGTVVVAIFRRRLMNHSTTNE